MIKNIRLELEHDKILKKKLKLLVLKIAIEIQF